MIKQISIAIALLLIVVGGIVGVSNASTVEQELTTDNYLRIHIRANSNEPSDQEIKYKVKDEVVKYLTPILANAANKENAINLIKANLEGINEVASLVLANAGYNYAAKANLTNEYFPVRSYDDVVLESGTYDSLIINLGTGTGNNWWCVAYPPLCFVANDNGNDNVEYRSKILDIINTFFGGKK